MPLVGSSRRAVWHRRRRKARRVLASSPKSSCPISKLHYHASSIQSPTGPSTQGLNQLSRCQCDGDSTVPYQYRTVLASWCTSLVHHLPRGPAQTTHVNEISDQDHDAMEFDMRISFPSAIEKQRNVLIPTEQASGSQIFAVLPCAQEAWQVSGEASTCLTKLACTSGCLRRHSTTPCCLG